MHKQSSRSLALVLFLCAWPAFPQRLHATQTADRSGPTRSAPASYNAPRQDSAECKQQVDPLPARGGSVDWGLALSGGGLRAGSFSVGVLKGLYQLGLLDQIDAISSVSGGGYASYWLLSNYDHPQAGAKFGEPLFEDKRFLRSMCELQQGSALITKKAAWKMIWQGKGDAFASYREAIVRSFGNRYAPEEKTFNKLNEEVERGRIPYFIFNTALRAKDTSTLGKVFEITPVHMGNPVIGFCSWDGNSCERPGLSEAVGISGAAIKFKWARRIPNDRTCLDAGKQLNLSDGGYAENLGALALIRRGVKNIIIVDSTRDHKYKFSNYQSLRGALRQMGIKLSVGEIDAYLDPPKNGAAKVKPDFSKVIRGTAKSAPDATGALTIDSQIFYIKLTRPEKGEFSEADINSGRALAEKLPKRQGAGALNCSALDGVDFQRELYVFRVKDYMDESERQEGGFRKLIPSGLRANFPQIPTADQRYAPDLMEALTALGYLRALKLKDFLEPRQSDSPTAGR